MCGRFVIAESRITIAERFNAEVSDIRHWDWEANYNIPPTTVIPVVARNSEGDRALVPMRWGLHPHWKKEPPGGKPLFNARMETAAEKASFRTPWKRRRALIPMTGWYEWTKEQGGRQPWFIKPESGGLSAFAGLWEQWRVEEGITLLTCTILTEEADGPVSRLHHRNPVRLPEEQWDDWLDPDVKSESVMDNRLNGDDLVFWEVDREVNSNQASGSHLMSPSV